MTRQTQRAAARGLRPSRAAAALGALLVAMAAGLLPGTAGGFVARITNNANSVATARYFTCTSALRGGSGDPTAWFAYPFGENGGTTATDVSGNNRPGTYNGTVTYYVTNSGPGAVCARDTQRVITLSGNGYVSGPTTAYGGGPNTMAVEIWFKTSLAQGLLIGYSASRTGSSSFVDRLLYIGADGKLVFGLAVDTYRTLSSPGPVTDNTWHQAVGTLSSAGAALYLDGALVASNATYTNGNNGTGYWRMGWDNIAPWPDAPSSYYFNGSLSFAAAYVDASLTASQVAQLYAAGR